MRLPLLPICSGPLVLLLASCDFMYHYQRSAQVPLIPARERIESAIRNTPGTQEVRSYEDRTSSGWSLRGKLPPTREYRFTYNAQHGGGYNLRFASHPDGSMAYDQFVLSNNLMSPQEIDRDRKNMSAVELGLERGCGLSGLHSRVTEKVTGWQPESSLRLP